MFDHLWPIITISTKKRHSLCSSFFLWLKFFKSCLVQRQFRGSPITFRTQIHRDQTHYLWRTEKKMTSQTWRSASIPLQTLSNMNKVSLVNQIQRATVTEVKTLEQSASGWTEVTQVHVYSTGREFDMCGTSSSWMGPIWNLRMMIQSSPRISVRSPSTTFSGPIRSTLILVLRKLMAMLLFSRQCTRSRGRLGDGRVDFEMISNNRIRATPVFSSV